MTLREKWSVAQLSSAMESAVRSHANPKFVKTTQGKLLFNGFWRDGNKANVCTWLNKATWADAKTGDGGGCKEFAKVAFNLSLSEFMDQFGKSSHLHSSSKIDSKKQCTNFFSVNDLWNHLRNKDGDASCIGDRWLADQRGFDTPSRFIGSGFVDLKQEHVSLFLPHYRNFVHQLLSVGPQLIVPIRGTHSGEVENLFFRALSYNEERHKSRLLPETGGWTSAHGGPRAFGFPHLINDFSRVILCEGMADYFAVECLLSCNENYLALGAANASALATWAEWFSRTNFKGHVTILYQLDTDKHGALSAQAIGQTKAVQALKLLLQHKVSASLFNWSHFLKQINSHEHRPKDIADVCKIFRTSTISNQFVATLNEVMS